MVAGSDKGKTKRRRRRRKKGGIVGPPFQVKAFGKHLTSWNESGRTIYARPKKNLLFTHLIFQQKTFSFFDTKYETTAIYEAVKPEDMTEHAEELYRRVKSMECVLARRGVLRRELFFRPSPFLTEVQKFIPGVVPSDELARALNEDGELSELLDEVKPDELSISLHSVPAQYQPFSRSREALIQGMREFYEKPKVVAWIITIVNVLTGGPGIQRKADRIVALLQRTAQALENKTKEMGASLSQGESVEKAGVEAPSPAAGAVAPQA